MDDRAQRALWNIRQQQRHWAESRGIELDPDGLVPDVASNLFAELCAETRRELERDPTRPLGEHGKPARLRALESTEALVLNFFAPWRSGNVAEVAALCGADPRATRLCFATPGADVLFEGDAARPTAVVATFAEPYAEVDGRLDGSELEPPERWRELPGCLHLARDLVHGARRFRTLEVGRLLARARDLGQRFGVRGFRMLYVWFESEGAAAHLHRVELDRLRMRIGGEVDFATRTWQDLFRALGKAEVGYSRDLEERYFPRTGP